VTLALGAVFAGHYRVVGLLGRGGMGEVYEVLDTRVDRKRALKVLHRHAADDPAVCERFELEARLGGRVDSPALVEVFDAGVDPATDRLYLVMELLRGETLAARLHRLGPRPPSEVVDHLAAVALALDRMHARDIVHRDLKPANLFLQDETIKVLDLGVAKVLNAGRASTTQVAGTPLYMSPEQLRGRGITAATDRYALGMVAYTLLTGRAYWASEGALDPMAFALRAVQGPPEPASTRAGIALPAKFDAWFAVATHAEPERRFAAAAGQIRALAGALELEPPESLRDVPDEEVRAPTPVARAATTSATEGATQAPPVTLAATIGIGRSRWWIGAFATLGAGIAAVMVARACATDEAKPLDAVACPVFEVADPARDGWLGAAAATVACERTRVLLGGAAKRAVSPPALLDLPLAPIERFPTDPYDDPTVRTRSLAAARTRGLAVLDGTVHRTPDGFAVELTVRDPNGQTLARTAGRDAALFAAVREAMDPLIAKHVLATTPPDPAAVELTRARTTDAALGYLDLTMALAHHTRGLWTECERAAVPAELAPWFRYECAYTLGRSTGEVELPTTAEAVRVRIEHMRYQRDDPAARERLVQAYREQASPIGRSMLALTLSCAYQLDRPEEALDWAQRAVQADPRNSLGERCAPWVQLATLSLDTERAAAVTAAWRGWAPWDSYAWSLAADREIDPEVGLRYARRAHELSPLDTYVAGRLADRLLRRGLREEARAIAVELGVGEEPVQRLEAELITVRVEASAARFASALAHAEAGLKLRPADHGWVRQQRLELAWHAVELGQIVGRTDLADRAFAELLAPKTLPFDGGHIDTPLRLTAICMYTSAAVTPACFARLAEVLPALSGGVVTGTSAFVDGARHYAAGDLRAAARAWRPLVANAHTHVEILGEAMVRAFAADGAWDLVDRVVELTAPQATELNGASLVTVRAALAARARGDHAREKVLADAALAAWSLADTEIPILRELRR
jgi:serine/threonine protein kinase